MLLAQGGLCHDPGLCKTLKLGFWRQFGKGVLTEACTYVVWDGSGTHSDPRIRRVEWAAVIVQGVSNFLGQTLECRKRHGERLMNSLKPAGGWMGRAELMACRLRDPQEKAG